MPVLFIILLGRFTKFTEHSFKMSSSEEDNPNSHILQDEIDDSERVSLLVYLLTACLISLSYL